MNIVIKGSKWRESDLKTLFGDEDVIFSENTDIPRLLVELGICRSTSQARQTGRIGEVPGGWHELKASKKHFLWIWNPTE